MAFGYDWKLSREGSCLYKSIQKHCSLLVIQFVDDMTNDLIVDHTELWHILMNWDLMQNRRMFHKQRVNNKGLVFPCVCKAWKQRLPTWIQAAVDMDQAAAAAAGELAAAAAKGCGHSKSFGRRSICQGVGAWAYLGAPLVVAC